MKVSDSSVQLVAFHLPQFHSIPENDTWWGEGFTEWANVRRAQALFRGHNQPRVPSAEIGYYNLLDPKTFEWQVRIAKLYGLGGFCFYHFWFAGKLLLEKPLHMWLSRSDLDFSYCLAWANEPWTRRWDGREEDVLQHQNYGNRKTWRKHFRYLLPFLEDPRAIRVDNKPLILIYRIGHVRHPRPMLECWREEAWKSGLPGIFVVSMLNGFSDPESGVVDFFDGACEFAPFSAYRGKSRQPSSLIIDYDEAWGKLLELPSSHQSYFRGAFVGWDNTPRRGLAGKVFHGSTPEKYARYLSTQIERVSAQPIGRRLLFLNAWNEWGEGCYLEPDALNGYAFLEATRAALASAAKDLCSVAELKSKSI